MPDICNNYMSCNDRAHEDKSTLFARNCSRCGTITAFADDAIYVTANKHREQNQNKLIQIMDRMKEYMANSRMTINPSKTLIWEFIIKQKWCKTQGVAPSLLTITDQGNTKKVCSKESSTYLGGVLERDLQWKAHLETGEDAILPILRKKLGALKYVHPTPQGPCLRPRELSKLMMGLHFLDSEAPARSDAAFLQLMSGNCVKNLWKYK